MCGCKSPLAWMSSNARRWWRRRASTTALQVGMQRRSTPHLMEARERYIQSGALGKIGVVEIYWYLPHARDAESSDDDGAGELRLRDVDVVLAPMRPYNELVHPRRWRAFMEYGNGIVGDMCVHMLDMTRWMMGLDGLSRFRPAVAFWWIKRAKPTSPIRKRRRSISAMWR